MTVKRDEHEFTVYDRLYGAWDQLEMAWLNLHHLQHTWEQTRSDPFPSDLQHIIDIACALSLHLEDAQRKYVDKLEQLA